MCCHPAFSLLQQPATLYHLAAWSYVFQSLINVYCAPYQLYKCWLCTGITLRRKKIKIKVYTSLTSTCSKAETVITWIGSNVSLIIWLWVDEKAGKWTEVTSAYSVLYQRLLRINLLAWSVHYIACFVLCVFLYIVELLHLTVLRVVTKANFNDFRIKYKYKLFSSFTSKICIMCPISQATWKVHNTLLSDFLFLLSLVEWLPIVASSCSVIQCQ